MASYVAVPRCLSLLHAVSSPRPCSSVHHCRLSHLGACDVMVFPELSRAAMFGFTDGYTVWMWIVNRAWRTTASRSPLAWGRR